MEEIKTQAIVLKDEIYKDSGKLLSLFSLENGLIKAKIQGVVKPKAKLAFCAQPFNFGEYILVYKNGYTVINCTQIESFYNVTKDFDKFIAGSQILEIISILARENEENPSLFVLALKALKELSFKQSHPLAVLIKFMIEAIKNAGYQMKLDACAVCGDKNPIKEKFSFSFGARVCSVCADNNSISLSAGESAVLKNIDATDIENLENLKFKGLENLTSVVKILLKYFSEKTGAQLKAIKEYL